MIFKPSVPAVNNIQAVSVASLAVTNAVMRVVDALPC